MRQAINTLCFVSAFVAVLWPGLHYSAQNDAKLAAKSDCIVQQAQAQGYSGNPYGLEAWQTFGALCN